MPVQDLPLWGLPAASFPIAGVCVSYAGLSLSVLIVLGKGQQPPTQKGETMLGTMIRFFRELAKPVQPPSWDGRDDNVVLYEDKYVKHRLFPGIRANDALCVKLVPPYSGRAGTVADKLIQVCREEVGDTYVYELLPAPDGEMDLDALVQSVVDFYERFERPNIAVGVCQGAWALAAALCLTRRPLPKAFFNFAGPIDFAAGGGWIETCVNLLPQLYYDLEFAATGGKRLSWAQWWAMASFDPWQVTVGEWVRLARAVRTGNRAEVAKWHRDRNWYWSPQDLSVWVLGAIKKLFIGNELVQGKLAINGRRCDLRKIDCPVYLVGGDRDEITPPIKVYNMGKYVSSNYIEYYEAKDCGHTAVFTREEPLQWFRERLRALRASGVEGEMQCGRI